MSIKSLLVIAATGVLMVSTAQAHELDRVQSAPQGLIVREDAQGNKEFFRDNGTVKITSEAAAAELAKTAAVDSNKIAAPAIELSELDRTTSNEAWFYYWGAGWGWGGYGWGYPSYYGLYYGGYYNYYYPAYAWGWGGYRYSYWCW